MPKKALGLLIKMGKNKQELLDEVKVLADKHAELKKIVLDILDEMDRIELECIKIKEKIRQ